jgi:hypothetical protein
MRALGTQLRLRRLLRAYGDYLERLSAGPEDRHLRAAARLRLLEMLQGLRETWRAEAAESLGGRELAGLRRHVSRSLSAMEAALAGLEQPGTSPERRSLEFQEAALPLVFFLRGLEELPERQVLEWLRPRPLQESA